MSKIREWPRAILYPCRKCGEERRYNKVVGYDAYKCTVCDYLVNTSWGYVQEFPHLIDQGGHHEDGR